MDVTTEDRKLYQTQFNSTKATISRQEDDSFAEENAIYQGWVVTEDGDHFCPKCTKEMLESGAMQPNPEYDGEPLFWPCLSALDLFAAEREKQISKGYTVEHDQRYNPECQLAAIASDLCFPYEIEQAPEPPVPINWHPKYWKKLINLPYEDRLRIAGAMLLGELDRIIHIVKKENE